MADHSPGPPSGAAGGVSTVCGGEDLGPESTVPTSEEGQKNSSKTQAMSELLVSILMMAPWRLKATRLKTTLTSAHLEPAPTDMETDKADKSNPKRVQSHTWPRMEESSLFHTFSVPIRAQRNVHLSMKISFPRSLTLLRRRALPISLRTSPKFGAPSKCGPEGRDYSAAWTRRQLTTSVRLY